MVVGEALIDVVRTGDAVTDLPGGSAANAAVALARLGRAVEFWTGYGADAHGALLDAHLAASGVVLAADPRVLDRTPTATATIGVGGAASYRFDVSWDLPELSADALARVRAVHVCSWGPVLAPGARAVEALLASSAVPISYDVNVRGAVTGVGAVLREAVERTARHATLVKASDEDLEVLYPGLGTAEAAARVRALGPAAVVVTRGAEGASWYGARSVHVSARPVAVVDTIGAGDTFGAALVDALLDDGMGALDALATARIEAVLERAGAAAAIAVSREGADPPYAAELEAAVRG
ncbi:MAG: PfkB family carbohydrate kinase [Nocardioides sp.]|uniref:PfkB family carbohydrate kinase n=1 Tax=Nocardioides sp. TaxID=35761 RepID=UPI0039E4DE83